MAFKTEAIVLRGRVFYGPDRVYDVLTPREGRLTVVARSAARSSSKLAGSMQSFDHVRLMVGRGRQDHLAGAVTITSNARLRDSFFDFILASSLVELVLRSNVPGEQAAQEFELLRATLARLSREAPSGEKIVNARIFLWKLLALSGWRPNIEQCAICRKELDSTAYYRSPSGFMCGAHGLEGLRVDMSLRQFLARLFMEEDLDELTAVASGNGFSRTWLELSQLFYQDIISQPIESIRLLAYV